MDRNDIIAYLTKKGYTGLHLYPREDLLELYQKVVAESRKDMTGAGPKLFNKLVPRHHLKAAQEQLQKNIVGVPSPPTPKLPANLPPYVKLAGVKQPIFNPVLFMGEVRQKNHMMIKNMPIETIMQDVETMNVAEIIFLIGSYKYNYYDDDLTKPLLRKLVPR